MRSKLYNRDGIGYSPAAIEVSKLAKPLFQKLWRECKKRGFSFEETFMLLQRDLNFHLTVENMTERLGDIERKRTKRWRSGK